ncbi:hypothetical protein NMG60_11012206 [Bertholletia excelsa]
MANLSFPPFTEIRGHIEVGSAFEIDHTELPPRTPALLRSIRVVMVSEKTEYNVSVRYPSTQSLLRYLSNLNTEMFPEMDERFVMGIELADKLLYRKVNTQEFAEKKDKEEFWTVVSNSGSKNAGTCLSVLKGSGMVRWGVRRQVKFIGRHTENNPQPSSSIVKGVQHPKTEGNEEDLEEQIEEEEEEEEDDEVEEVLTEQTYEKQSGKRRRHSSRLISQTKAKNKCKQIVPLKKAHERWSAERYELAEKNLLEVMRAKGAVYGSPILRPELRAEARKRIGDTGLLDHLLKHMAGKVAPGGTERFRRRHSAEGAMEYWLESADLVDLRKDAGIQDPYWTPPPGWKPGDSLTQDPVCAKELKQLKEVTAKLARDLEEKVSRKQIEEEMAKLRREMEKMLSKKQMESPAIVASNPSPISHDLNLETAFVPSNSDLDSSLITLGKYKEQLTIVSDHVRTLEEEIRKIKTKEEKRTESASALMVSARSCAEKEKKKAGQKEVVGTEAEKEERTGGAVAEEKAAKLRRLRSSFRICKPPGTFRWPNTVQNSCSTANSSTMLSSQVVVKVEDLLVVPTPPSVSSSTSSLHYHHYHHHHHYPNSPVKPLAERRGLTITVSAAGENSISTTTKKSSTTLINLNDPPTSADTPSSPISATTAMPMVQLVGESSGACPSKGEGKWLALGTPTTG